MDANDVQQGSLGNCYFLSALALVATNCVCADGLVDDALDQAGCYGVSFWVGGEWKMVWVDGYFPCYVSTNPHARAPPRPLYPRVPARAAQRIPLLRAVPPCVAGCAPARRPRSRRRARRAPARAPA